MTSTTPTVLFLCVQNAGRSQMAAGWMRHLAGEAVQVLSGGSRPADAVHAGVADAMAEIDIDVTGERPRTWAESDLEEADVVVTMGCGDTCPVLPGKRYVDWELDDPSGQSVEVVRLIRDDIGERVRGLLTELRATTPAD